MAEVNHLEENFIRLIAKAVARETVDEAHARHRQDIMEQMPQMITEITERICMKFNTDLEVKISNILGANINDIKQIREVQDDLIYAHKQRVSRDANVLTVKDVVVKRTTNLIASILLLGLGGVLFKMFEFYSENKIFFLGSGGVN